MDEMEYEPLLITANTVASTLQRYLKEVDGWTIAKKTKDGTTVSYRQSTEFDGYLYKGETTLNAPPATVFQYVDPLPDAPRAKWDSNMKRIEVLKWMSESNPCIRINRACTASACMGLISPRDFVDVILTKETDDYISTNARSVAYDGCPEEKKYVRGTNYSCGLICHKVPGEPNKTRLTSLIQPDIGGMLPRSLVDGVIPSSMLTFFSELNGALEKDGKIIKS